MPEQAADFELSELDYVRAAIPDGSRIESPILLRVNEVQQTPLSDNAPVVKVSDRNGNPFDINVWDTHEVNVEWKIGHWYVVSGAWGSVRDTEAEDVKHRLSSSADFRADWLGQGIDPEPVAIQPKESTVESTDHNHGNTSEGTESDTECRSTETNSRDAEEIYEESEDGSVTDEIISDFEL